MPVLTDYLTVSAALLAIGLFGVIWRRNTVAVLMSIELILNAASLNFVAFSHFVTGDVTGHVFALFVIILAGAEAAVGMALVLVIYHNFRSINVDDASTLRS